MANIVTENIDVAVATIAGGVTAAIVGEKSMIYVRPIRYIDGK
jgi:hypothetical protein